jgi:flagellar hook-length control protein FliK
LNSIGISSVALPSSSAGPDSSGTPPDRSSSNDSGPGSFLRSLANTGTPVDGSRDPVSPSSKSETNQTDSTSGNFSQQAAIAGDNGPGSGTQRQTNTATPNAKSDAARQPDVRTQAPTTSSNNEVVNIDTGTKTAQKATPSANKPSPKRPSDSLTAAAAKSESSISPKELPTAPNGVAKLLSDGRDAAADEDQSAQTVENSPPVPPAGLVKVLSQAAAQANRFKNGQSSSTAQSVATPAAGDGKAKMTQQSSETDSTAPGNLLSQAGALFEQFADKPASTPQDASVTARVDPSSAQPKNSVGLEQSETATSASLSKFEEQSLTRSSPQAEAAIANGARPHPGAEPAIEGRTTTPSVNTQPAVTEQGASSKSAGKNPESTPGDSPPVSVPQSALGSNVSVGSSGRSLMQSDLNHASTGLADVSPRQSLDLADRVTNTLRTAFGSEGELRVRLEPPELGQVHIEVLNRDGGLTARIEVQSHAARSTLLDNISLLHDAIGRTGATVNHIEVEFVPAQKDDSNADHQRSAGDHQNGANQGGNQENSDGQADDRRGRSSNGTRSMSIDELDIAV